jgi:hypothetical protein
MTRLTRQLNDRELSAVKWKLMVGLLEGLGLWKELCGGFVAEKVVSTTVGEADLEEDMKSTLKLEDARVQRVQVFLAPPEGLGKLLWLREKIIEGIREKDSSLLDENGVVMTVDFVTADAFRHPFHLDLKRVVFWIGRLLARRAIFVGDGSILLLEFGRDLGPEEWIAVGAGFSPTEWRVQGRRVLLYR